MTISGGCRCGAVRYTLAIDALPAAYACHCHICQRWSGSAFSMQVLVTETELAIDGPVGLLELTTEDRASSQRYCERCHSRIYNTNTRCPGIAVVRAGTLDRSEVLRCVVHIFTAYRQHWFDLPKDVPSWPEAPPPDEFIAALQR